MKDNLKGVGIWMQMHFNPVSTEPVRSNLTEQ